MKRKMSRGISPMWMRGRNRLYPGPQSETPLSKVSNIRSSTNQRLAEAKTLLLTSKILKKYAKVVYMFLQHGVEIIQRVSRNFEHSDWNSVYYFQDHLEALLSCRYIPSRRVRSRPLLPNRGVFGYFILPLLLAFTPKLLYPPLACIQYHRPSLFIARLRAHGGSCDPRSEGWGNMALHRLALSISL